MMKYRTFVKLRAAAIAGAAALVGWGGCRALDNDGRGDPAPPPPARSTDTPNPAAPAVGSADPAATTDLHRAALEMLREPLERGVDDGKSVKWRAKRGRQVIELRCDRNKGAATWNRVKIDADGDKRFDELWEVGDGDIRRKVSPADDETYPLVFRREGDAWAPR